MLALRATDGEVIWTRPPKIPALHAPIVSGDLVFAVVEGATIVAVRAEDGDLVWTRTLEGTLSAPVAARDRILIGSTANVLYALDPKRGIDVWKFPVGGDVIGAAVDGDVVYFASLDNILRAVSRGSGNQRWKTIIPTRPGQAPIAFDGVVILTGVAPRVDGYDGRTGKAQGSYTAPGDLEGPALVDRLAPYRVAMVTITRDGRVAAVRSSPMMMREPAPSPLTVLPGRRLGRETPPTPAS
jgi:outer membrane protein assembly factor BamB